MMTNMLSGQKETPWPVGDLVASFAGGKAKVFGLVLCDLLRVDHIAAIWIGMILFSALGWDPDHISLLDVGICRSAGRALSADEAVTGGHTCGGGTQGTGFRLCASGILPIMALGAALCGTAGAGFGFRAGSRRPFMGVGRLCCGAFPDSGGESN